MSDTPDITNIRFVSVESPYNAICPWYLCRNIQYAILCNTHASSLGDVSYAPHIANTQFVKWGFNGYISDSLNYFLKLEEKYHLGRDKTLENTNEIRKRKMDCIVCYTDYGISSGMKMAIKVAEENGVPIEFRKLPTELKNEIIGETVKSSLIPLIIPFLTIFGFVKLFI